MAGTSSIRNLDDLEDDTVRPPKEETIVDMEEESGFDEEADALYMGNIMEDDDNDEGGEYTLDPVDNE